MYISFLFASSFYLADILDTRDCHGRAEEQENKWPKQQHIRNQGGWSLPRPCVTGALWEMKDPPAYKYWDPGNWLVSYSLGCEPLDP